MSRRLRRQTIVEALRQDCVARCRLVLVPTPETAPMMSLLARWAATFGFERQVHATLGGPCLEGIGDTLRLCPELTVATFAADQVGPFLRSLRTPWFTVAVADATLEIDRGRASLSQGASRIYYVARGPNGLVTGLRRREVLGAAAGLRTRRRKKMPAACTAADPAEACGAAALLGNLVAETEAWCPDDIPSMPVDQEIRVFAAPRGASGSGTAEPQAAGAGTLLVVGAGGGLGHAFLESLLLDAELRRAFARIVLVDSDRYEDSNANRQTLMGSIEAVGKAKAVVTKDEIERRWPRGEPRPSIVAVPEPIAREHVADFRPDVVALLADNFHARDVAYRALQDLDGPRVAICAGTDFIYGQTRAVLLGEGSCLDHGPEHLGESALAEDGRGPSCGASPTPANVLTNALCGAHAALQARRWVTTGSVEPRQVLIHWMLPERARLGPVWDPCSCATAKGAAA